MFRNTKAFASFSVSDLASAKSFYADTLGLVVKETPEGLELHLAGGGMPVFIYPSDDYHAPEHTILNFIVDDIDATVKKLAGKKVRAEQYDMPGMKTGPDGIWRNRGQDHGAQSHGVDQGPRCSHHWRLATVI